MRRSKSAQRTNSGFEDEVGMMATPRVDTEAARAAQSPSIMGPLSTRTTGDFTRHDLHVASATLIALQSKSKACALTFSLYVFISPFD